MLKLLTSGQLFSNPLFFILGLWGDTMIWSLLSISLTWQPDNSVFVNFYSSHFFFIKTKIFIATILYTDKEYHTQMDFLTRETPSLTPFKFQVNYHYIQEFEEWWSNYHHAHYMESKIILQILTDDFWTVQTRFKEGTCTHIQEI